MHLFRPSEIDVVKFLTFLVQNKYSYSVVNTYRSMFTQILQYFNVQWVKNPLLFSSFMKGFFNLNPPRQKCLYTWDVSKVLQFLRTLMPLCDLSLKMLTLKLIALAALTTASRAQTISALHITFMCKYVDKIVFYIQKVLKTSRPGVSLPKITFFKYEKP